MYWSIDVNRGRTPPVPERLLSWRGQMDDLRVFLAITQAGSSIEWARPSFRVIVASHDRYESAMGGYASFAGTGYSLHPIPSGSVGGS